MQDLIDNWENVAREDIRTVLDYNQNLWNLFVERAEAVEPPKALQKTIISLGGFVFQRSRVILSTQELENPGAVFGGLISVNRQIAGSLMKS